MKLRSLLTALLDSWSEAETVAATLLLPFAPRLAYVFVPPAERSPPSRWRIPGRVGAQFRNQFKRKA